MSLRYKIIRYKHGKEVARVTEPRTDESDDVDDDMAVLEEEPSFMAVEQEFDPVLQPPQPHDPAPPLMDDTSSPPAASMFPDAPAASQGIPVATYGCVAMHGNSSSLKSASPTHSIPQHRFKVLQMAAGQCRAPHGTHNTHAEQQQ